MFKLELHNDHSNTLPLNRQTDGGMDEQTDGWTDGRTDGRTDIRSEEDITNIKCETEYWRHPRSDAINNNF